MRRFMLIGSLVIGVMLSGMTFGSALGPEDLMYRVRTVHNCVTQRVTPGIAGVPTLVDVDGNGAPDLIVQVGALPDPGVKPPHVKDIALPQLGALFRANIIKIAPGPMPAIVELIFRVPGQGTLGGPLAAAFGYDSCGQASPTTFSVQATMQRDALTVTMEQSGAGGALSLIGSFHEEGVDPSMRYYPHAARVTMTPPPQTATAIVTKQGNLTQAHLTTNIPTRLDVTYDNILFDRATHAEATVDQFPGDVWLRFGESHLDYTIVGSIGLLQVKLNYAEYGRQPIEVFGRMLNVQGTGAFDRTGATHAKFVATPSIGQVVAGFAEGGSVPLIYEGVTMPDYVRAITSGSHNGATVRLRGLSLVEVDWGDPISLDVTHAGGPMNIVANLGSTSINAWIKDLPSSVHIDYSKSQNLIHYAGNATISEITADVVSPYGLFGRVNEIHLLLQQVPSPLTLSLPAGGGISFDANGQRVGLVEARLTSGPDVRLPAGQDGFLLRDVTAYFAIHARITGLRKLTSSEFRTLQRSISLPPYGTVQEWASGRDVTIVTDGGRQFIIDINNQNSSTMGRVEYTNATIIALPAQATLNLRALSWVGSFYGLQSEKTGRTEVTYSGNGQTTPGLTFKTNAGHLNGGDARLEASLSPLPASLYLCNNDGFLGGYCSQTGRVANHGSMQLRLSDHATLNIIDCIDAGCTQDWTRVTNLRVRKIATENHEAAPSALFIDTDGYDLTGAISKYEKGVKTEETSFAPGFKAQDRYVQYIGLTWKATSGTISCPPPTAFWRWVIGAWINMATIPCN